MMYVAEPTYPLTIDCDPPASGSSGFPSSLASSSQSFVYQSRAAAGPTKPIAAEMPEQLKKNLEYFAKQQEELTVRNWV